MSNNHPYSMPQHSAPKRVWQELELRLEQLDAPMAIEWSALPEHKAPQRTWAIISEELQPRKEAISWKGKAWRWSAAAAVAATIAGVWTFVLPSNAIGNELTYSEEIIEMDEAAQKPHAEQRAMEIVQASCVSNISACSSEEFKNLQNELDELEDAKTKLENALGAYGTNESLSSQLSKIERERAAVLKKMVHLSKEV